jgi:glycosyltransferase involved in cell wall biosynthesis
MKPSRKIRKPEMLRLDPHGQQGLVSVIVPTYNRGYCVTKSIDSALAQTYRDIEVIVIDDGSTDNTREVIAEAFCNESRVNYVYQSNGGVSVARNHGFRLARGEFMALLDSDDIWKPWKTELQVRVLRERSEVGMVWTDMEAVDPDGQLIAPRYLRKMYTAYHWYPDDKMLFSESFLLPSIDSSLCPPGNVLIGDIFSPMMMGNLVHTSTVLMRRERLAQVGFFPENLRNAGEDYDFHLRTCHAGVVAYVDVSSIYYRVGWHDQIVMKDFNFFFARGYLKSIRRYLQSDPDRICLPKAMMQTMMAEAYGWIGGSLFEKGKRRAARKFLAHSLTYRLWQPRTLITLVRAIMPHWFDTLILKMYRIVKGTLKSASAEAS